MNSNVSAVYSFIGFSNVEQKNKIQNFVDLLPLTATMLIRMVLSVVPHSFAAFCKKSYFFNVEGQSLFRARVAECRMKNHREQR